MKNQKFLQNEAPSFLKGFLTLFLALNSFSISFGQEQQCQGPAEFSGEPESGFCNSQLPTCTTTLGTSITESSQIPSGFLTGVICIEGNFQISTNEPFSFINATLIIAPGVEIIINSNSSLVLDNAHLHGCNGLWKGIKLSNNTAVYVINNSLIEDAHKAINASYVSGLIQVDNSIFNRNIDAIWMEDDANATNPTYIASIFNTSFKCDAPIVGTQKEISTHGIYSRNCPISFPHSSEEIDHDLIFQNLKYGIRTEGDRPLEIIGNSFLFREIRYTCIEMARGAIKLENSHFIHFGDAGISNTGAHQINLDNCQFILNEFDPNYISTSSPSIWRKCITFYRDVLNLGVVPEINIHSKCEFVYNCPGIDEIFRAIEFGGIGSVYDLNINDCDFRLAGQNATGISIMGGNINSTADIFSNRFYISTEVPPAFSSYQTYGIGVFGNVNNIHIVGNTFEGSGEPSDELHHLINIGIDILQAYGQDNKVTDNEFFGQLWSGLSMLNGDNWKICNNSGIFTDRLFLFSGTNLDNDIVQNDIFLKGGIDINGKVFNQFQKDNRFFGLIFPTYARCISGDCWIFSRFESRHLVGSEYYPDLQSCGLDIVLDECIPAGEFFVHQNGVAQLACTDEIQDPGQEDFLLSIAEGEVENPNEYPSKLWRFKNHLFQKLKQDPILLSSDPLFQAFIDNETSTTVGKFYEVNKLLQEGLQGNSFGLDLTKLNLAFSLNENVVVTADFETNQKVINQIILTSFINQNEMLTNEELETLEQIAGQCPKLGGEATIQAAILLGRKKCNPTFFNIIESCNETAIPPISYENTQRWSIEKKSNRSLTDQLNISYNGTSLGIMKPINKSGIVYLFDFYGREIYKREAHVVFGLKAIALMKV